MKTVIDKKMGLKRPNLVPKFDKVLSAAAEKGRREGRTPGDTIYRGPGGGGHDCDDPDGNDGNAQ